ncbi:MAG: hypothetical protein M3R17_20110 [Bacteroidota bacterium]|nr:hypothetical protein [Bacteroidota bacterium]
MKQLFIISAFIFSVPCFSPDTLVAQTAKGDQLFGVMGTIGQTLPGLFLKSGRYDLYYQRFLAPRFSLGVNANFGYSYGYYDVHSNSIGGGIEARYYLLKKPSTFQPYVFGGLETNWTRVVYPYATTPPIWRGLQANTGVGFDWYLRPDFALNARGGIIFQGIEDGDPNARWNFKVGATFLLPHKEKKKVPVGN